MINKNGDKKKLQLFSFQTKCLTIFSIIFSLITIGLIILVIYNIYSSISKEISKLNDLEEFQELENIENILENIDNNIENFFKNTLQSIVNLYNESSNLDPTNIYNSDNDFNDDFMEIYLNNTFNNTNNYNNYLHLLIIFNTINNITKFYPENISEFNAIFNFEKKSLVQDYIKNYVKKKIVQKINDYIMINQILIHDIDYYNNLFLLPYYDDDNYSENNDLKELNNIFFNGTQIDYIRNIAFMVLKNEECIDDLNFNNLDDCIGKIFLLIGINDTGEIFYDEIKSRHKLKKVNVLRTNYLFPYELIEKQSCGDISNKDSSGLKYLDNCFDKNNKLDEYDKYGDFSTYDELLTNFKLFKNIMNNNSQYNSSLFNFYRILEKKNIQDKSTSFEKSIHNITFINNNNYKALKIYSPLQIIYQTDYYYPISNIKMHLIIINEKSIEDLLQKIKEIGENRLLLGSLLTLLIAIIYLITTIILVIYTQKEIQKQMDRMNEPNKLYYINDNETGIHIDEFEDIIKSMAFEFKYDSDVFNSGEKQVDDSTKLEMENFNKDFEKNKIFNILVDKEKINKMLEESNYSNEIINNSDLIKIRNDSFVKKSKLFRDCIQMGDSFESENYEENNGIVNNNIIFRDKNTLQNPNALFYKMFKAEFSENYKEEKDEDIINENNKKGKFLKKKNSNHFNNEDKLKILEENFKNEINDENNEFNINNDKDNDIDFKNMKDNN